MALLEMAFVKGSCWLRAGRLNFGRMLSWEKSRLKWITGNDWIGRGKEKVRIEKKKKTALDC